MYVTYMYIDSILILGEVLYKTMTLIWTFNIHSIFHAICFIVSLDLHSITDHRYTVETRDTRIQCYFVPSMELKLSVYDRQNTM